MRLRFLGTFDEAWHSRVGGFFFEMGLPDIHAHQLSVEHSSEVVQELGVSVSVSV